MSGKDDSVILTEFLPYTQQQYSPERSDNQKHQSAAEEGYKYAVCLDLSKYFDTLKHELLMNMLREDNKDKRLIELIKKYLKSGVMENGTHGSEEEYVMYI